MTEGEAGQANTVSTELPQFNIQLRSLPCPPLAPGPTMHTLYTSLWSLPWPLALSWLSILALHSHPLSPSVHPHTLL